MLADIRWCSRSHRMCRPSSPRSGAESPRWRPRWLNSAGLAPGGGWRR